MFDYFCHFSFTLTAKLSSSESVEIYEKERGRGGREEEKI